MAATSPIITFFYLVSTLISGISLSTIFVAYLFYRHANASSCCSKRFFLSQQEIEELNRIQEEWAFFEKYDEIFEKAPKPEEEGEMTDQRKKALKNSILMEPTQRGNIIVYFDHETDDFCYHSDNRNIPSKYLDAILKKYVATYRCKSIYLAKSRQIEEDNNNRGDDGVTVNKSSTKPSTKKNIHTTMDRMMQQTTPATTKPQQITSTKQPNNNNNNNKKEKEEPQQQIFIPMRHMGKINEFSFLQRIPMKEVVKKQSMTFADFKNMKR